MLESKSLDYATYFSTYEKFIENVPSTHSSSVAAKEIGPLTVPDRQQKEHRAKIAGLKRNDVVVTAGGLVGKVIKLDDHYVELELGPNVKVRAVRATIGDVVPPTGAAPAND